MIINKLILCQMVIDTIKGHGWEAAHDEYCRAHGVDYHYDAYGSDHKRVVLIDLRGYIAELAFADALGDLKYEYRDFVENDAKTAGKIDFKIDDNEIEVKTTQFAQPYYKKTHMANTVFTFTNITLNENLELEWNGSFAVRGQIPSEINTKSLQESIQDICSQVGVKYVTRGF